MIRLTLPFPVSTNTYYRHVRGKSLISKRGREYRKLVAQEVLAQGGNKLLASRLKMFIELHPPDRRRRDLDNFSGKSLWDAMEHAGVYLDDAQIDEYWVRRCEPVNGGRAVVTIHRMNGE